MADDAEQHEPAPAAVVGRLSTLPCFHCAAPSSKYRCPLCSHSLCSLPCSKTHACVATKVRSELVFTPLGHITEMTESVFVRDVRLLNETARCVDNAVRDRKRTAEDIVARRKSARIASAAKPTTTSREQQPNHNNQQQQHQQHQHQQQMCPKKSSSLRRQIRRLHREWHSCAPSSVRRLLRRISTSSTRSCRRARRCC
eukprot:comp21830_c1_seq1/m.49232 comp21830_c1_seq1/g.49232  ORF comp21830_c1_seq1/g.49232 comp21830_c1_seq1/m.49232 type:complete len:199 (-) comp21830_c1_seq1:1082-1678(-)